MYEQLNLFDISTQEAQKELLVRKDFYKEYVEVNKITGEEQCAWLDYLTFKCWLYTTFPIFTDKEIETDNWEIKYRNSKINVRLGKYYEDTHRQFVSVGYQLLTGNYHGWSCPCDTLGEVRERIEKALNEQH